MFPCAISSHQRIATERNTRPKKVTGIDGYSWRKYHCVSVPVVYASGRPSPSKSAHAADIPYARTCAPAFFATSANRPFSLR